MARVYKMTKAYISIPDERIDVLDTTGFNDVAELVFTANIRIANLPLTFGDGRGHILAKTTDTVILEALTHVRFDQSEDFTIAALDVSKVNWKAVRPRKATVWVTESVPGFYKVYGTSGIIFSSPNAFDDIDCSGPADLAEPPENPDDANTSLPGTPDQTQADSTTLSNLQASMDDGDMTMSVPVPSPDLPDPTM
eukprot:jgi/Botrbrau1/4565/Bobra.60_2s0052.1